MKWRDWLVRWLTEGEWRVPDADALASAREKLAAETRPGAVVWLTREEMAAITEEAVGRPDGPFTVNHCGRVVWAEDVKPKEGSNE